MEYRNIFPALDYRKQFAAAQVNLLQLIQDERIRKRMQQGLKKSNLPGAGNNSAPERIPSENSSHGN
jgi:hypothetical protein